MVNHVVLKGNLSHDPYYDLVEATGVPFLRFYLAVSLPHDLALVNLKGNVVQPPYFDRVGDEAQPFMRLYLAVNRARRSAGEDQKQPQADFIRVVAYDDCALFSFPYLRPGSEVLVIGNLRARKRKMSRGETETVVEVVADDDGITFLSKIDWQSGDAQRERILSERAAQPVPERADPVLRGGGFFRVVCYGGLAQLCFPYLQAGSSVFVRGRLRSRKHESPDGRRKTVVEIAAQDIKFLDKINWRAGDAERDREMRLSPVAWDASLEQAPVE